MYELLWVALGALLQGLFLMWLWKPYNKRPIDHPYGKNTIDSGNIDAGS